MACEEEDFNAVAAEFVSQHEGWQIVLDSQNNVVFISSPIYQFSVEYAEEGDESPGSSEPA